MSDGADQIPAILELVPVVWTVPRVDDNGAFMSDLNFNEPRLIDGVALGVLYRDSQAEALDTPWNLRNGTAGLLRRPGRSTRTGGSRCRGCILTEWCGLVEVFAVLYGGREVMLRAIRCCVVMAICGCTGPSADGPGVAPALVSVPWNHGDDRRPDLDHGFFDDHPALTDLSLYATKISGVEPSDHQARGAFGVGNGRVFALGGLSRPANTLHGLIGPVYRTGSDGFFGDVSVGWTLGGGEVVPDKEWVARPRGQGMMVTRADAGRLSLYTVDFAPHPAGVDALDVPPVLVRAVLIRSEADVPVDATVRLDFFHEPEMGALGPVERMSDRVMAVGTPSTWMAGDTGGASTGSADTGSADTDTDSTDAGVNNTDTGGADTSGVGDLNVGWSVDLGALPAGGQRVVWFVIATGFDEEEAQAHLEAALAADLDAWLGDTLSWWAGLAAQGMQLTTSDPRIADLVDGMRVGVATQTSDWGGVSPMSRYTGTWLRDTYGPVRFFGRVGLHDQADAMLDYLHACHVVRGDIGNSCTSGLVPDEVGEEPDWASKPVFSGRTAAEGPSYLPMQYGELARWTGDNGDIDARWPYLSRALLAQQIDDEGRQTFSGDETFRLAMNVAFGLDLEVPWEELAWSSNSGFLMAAAADVMAAQAARRSDDPAPFEDLATSARAGLETHFLMPEGHFAAVQRFEGASETMPFEDVALKAVWSGAYSADDPVASSSIEALKEAVWREEGAFQSPVAPLWENNPLLPLTEGYFTGMLPGYSLSSLSTLGDPDADAAFRRVSAYALSSGQFAEGMSYGEFTAFQPFYDGSGGLGDIAARYRPWEGSIVADAVVQHLVGVEPDAGVVVVRPHLVDGLREMTATHILVPGARLDVVATQDDGDLTVSVTVTEGTAEMAVRIPIPLHVPEGSLTELDGEWVSAPGGRPEVVFDAVRLDEGDTRTWSIRWRVAP